MTEDTRIRKLDPATVDRIAAGEVVERPASAVKELVENSLDADADRIDVVVEDGGTAGIRVADDGVGMSEADVRAAVRKHTTSKIRDIGDLEGGVSTLGFRGEALATIGAVSRLTVTTRPRDGGDAATELRLEGGEVTHVGPAGRPPGTTVAVEDLFYNTPARRKYLKTDATEFAHVNRVVTRYALANPDVAVSLSHNGGEVFATTGRGDLQSTLLAVYGRTVAEAMIPVDGEGAGPVEGVRGYVSHPETTRSTREYVATYVNGRYVDAAAVRDAALAAYGNQLAPDRFPFAVLFLDVPADGVDVNVHPRKLAVRFGDEEGVREAVRGAVEDALLEEGIVRSGAPRGKSAPDDVDVRPDAAQSDLGAVGSGADNAPERHTERPDAGRATDNQSTAAVDRHDAVSGAASPNRERDRDAPSDRAPAREDRRDPAYVPADRKFRAVAESDRLGDETAAETGEFDTLPPLRVLGQFRDTYVVAASPDGLVLVDQHAADERVNYEALAEAVAGQTDSQSLVEPVEVELTAQEAAVFEAALADVEDLGFDVRLGDDGRTAVVTAVPAVLSDALGPGLVRDVLTAFVREDRDHGDVVASAADALLADMACYPSITGNTALREGRIVDLLARLDDCENPWACPHGRPTLVAITEREIEERFERDYPGHQFRRPEE